MIITHTAENTLCQGVYYFPMSEWFYGTCIMCNFIYVHKISVAVPAPSFTKTQDAQQHYVQIAYTKLHLNMDRCSFIPLYKVWLSLHQYLGASRLFKFLCMLVPNFIQIGWKMWKISCILLSKVRLSLRWCSQTHPCSRTTCTVFHENLTHHSVADTRSWKDCHSLLYFTKNAI
jgi:hypothetical protein